MYSQERPDSTGFLERRMTARTVPPTMPMTIAMTVSSMVRRTPVSTSSLNNQSGTTPHWRFLFFASE